LSVPEYGYAVELPLYEDVFVDIDAEDGALDVLSVSPSMNEDAPDWYDGFTIMIGDSECEEKDLSFGRIVPYYVYLGDYNSYLYLELTSENDYNTLMVYDISYGYPSWSMTLEGTGFDSMYYEEDEYFAEEVLTDPSKFTLTTRVEVLGTHSGRKTYHANAYFGDPETIDNAYDMSLYGDFITVTSSRPLEVVMISTGEKETIPAGTKFEYLRTDNESFAELRLEDGRVCRVSVDVTEYPALINGISEDDCFSDIMYAG